jgi:hypothetical protein
LVADDGEKSLKGFDGSFAARPKQAGDVEIETRVKYLCPFGILDLIDAGREVRKASAVSFHDSHRAQRAKKSI